MAIASYRDLCIDALDVGLVAGFWAELLGLAVAESFGGAATLRRDGDVVLRIEPVSEPKVVKNRVHLDLCVAPGTDLAARGASSLADHEVFRVHADPEGNELCAFPPPPDVVLDAPARWFGLCTDSARPVDDARWWAGVVGGELGPGPDGDLRYLHGAAGLGDVTWKFVPVDDPRTVANRWRWEVSGSDEQLVAAGATLARPAGEGRPWSELTDPSGNAFRALA